MIRIDCEQGSDEWWQARLGIATASSFDKIVTPGKLQPSQQADGYQLKLLGEWLRGKPDESFQSEWMKRGHEEEPDARSLYEFMTDTEVQQVGFCKDDHSRYGASPDGLIGDDGALEIKSPSPGVHVGYLLDNRIPTTYRLQCAGVLLVCERQWIDFMSYHADMNPLIVRMTRTDVKRELEALESALTAFHGVMETRKQALIDRGCEPLREAA